MPNIKLTKSKECKINFFKLFHINSHHVITLFLQQVDQICDLGVTFESSLSFSIHMKNICGQSFKLLGFIYRNTKNFKYSNCLKVLFNSLVRSKQEYCSLIWSPHVQHQSDQIERVKNKFLKIISYKFSSCLISKLLLHLTIPLLDT